MDTWKGGPMDTATAMGGVAVAAPKPPIGLAELAGPVARRQRWRRALFVASGLLAVVAVGLGVVAATQRSAASDTQAHIAGLEVSQREAVATARRAQADLESLEAGV